MSGRNSWVSRPVDEFVRTDVAADVANFLVTPIPELVESLAGQAALRSLEVSPEQKKAWETTIEVIGRALWEAARKRPGVKNWSVVLEYSIPRRNTRPDVVVLADGVVVVIEMKVGSSTFDRADQNQARNYAYDFRDFHEGSLGRSVVPVLCATQSSTSVFELREEFVQLAAPSDLGDLLLSIVDKWGTDHPIELDDWDHSRYRPTPNIVETALDVYAGNDVREISHAHADNLTDTVDRIRQVIEDAELHHRRVLCLVTGVPGAGKTLAGLSAVHSASSSPTSDRLGVYLSGNGPLVKVLRYAIARDRSRRMGTPFREASRQASVLIQPVHGFIEELSRSDKVPPEHVIVFDEAQRAWDADRMSTKQSIEDSEAGATLDIMSRTGGWAVVVALIGEGQEINTGEAGILPWIEAASVRPDWAMVGPPHLAGADSFSVDDKLHLAVGVRTPRARDHPKWVEAVLAGDVERASEIAAGGQGLPLHLSRDLDETRDYLFDQATVDRRIGLLASAQARRLNVFGIQMNGAFQGDVHWDRWFVDPAGDIRSSYALEVAASEFKCQGLEIDWAGLCWGQDFTWNPASHEWNAQRLRGSSWTRDSRVDFAQNRYRVLLTRARFGMVIWVPKPERDHLLVDPDLFERTASYLMQCGVAPLGA